MYGVVGLFQLAGPDEARLVGVNDELCTVTGTKFHHRTAYVCLSCCRANDELFGYIRVGQSRRHQCHHFALSLGQRSRTSGRDEDAALWFAEAARMDSTSATGRQALFAYGETRLAQGDTLAAALAFQAIAAEGAVSDSFTGKARARLETLGLTPVTGPDPGAGTP